MNKMKRCLSFHWQLSSLHYSVTFNISWLIVSEPLVGSKMAITFELKPLSIKFYRGNGKGKKVITVISFIINSYYTIIKYKIVVEKDKRIQCFFSTTTNTMFKI